MVCILPFYLFWKARSGTCRIIVCTILLVSLFELENVLYIVRKVFSVRFQRIRDRANWIVGSRDIQGASLEKGFRRKSTWGLESVPEEASLNVRRGAVIMNRTTPAVTRAGGRTIFQGIITRNRFLSTILPIFSLSLHFPNRTRANLVPKENCYQRASNDVAYEGNDRKFTGK